MSERQAGEARASCSLPTCWPLPRPWPAVPPSSLPGLMGTQGLSRGACSPQPARSFGFRIPGLPTVSSCPLRTLVPSASLAPPGPSCFRASSCVSLNFCSHQHLQDSLQYIPVQIPGMDQLADRAGSPCFSGTARASARPAHRLVSPAGALVRPGPSCCEGHLRQCPWEGKGVQAP